MKLKTLFSNFLVDVVNLNETRLNLLESSVETLQGVLKASTIGKHIVGFEE